jgi:cephalosporin hydroxylase
MDNLSPGLKFLEKNWKKLKRLHPILIDLTKIELIREQSLEFLADAERLKSLILELGLTDDSAEEFPESIYPYCGHGLYIMQYPIQFNQYLLDLSRLKIRSYLEVGVRHGGTFITTVEYLNRFYPLDFAVGIDIMPCPSIVEYQKINPQADFVKINTQTNQFSDFLSKYERFDLVLIDANHEENECRNEFTAVKNKANIIVFHDIDNIDFPGVKKVWNEVKASGKYNCCEYTEQYAKIGPYMGIGMAIDHDRQPYNI